MMAVKALKIGLFLCLVFFWSVLVFPAEALIVPQVYFTEIKLERENFLPGETIQGSVSLWNYEKFVISDLVFHFELLGGEVDGVATQMINQKKGEEIFSLLPEQKTTKSFAYELPANLPEGSLKFRVQLANNKGEEMSWIDKVIDIGGEGEFLMLDNYWIIKEGEKLSAGAGVYYQPGEIPQVRFDAANESRFTISSFFKVITYRRNIGQFLSEATKENVIFKPGEKLTLETFLPALTEPQTYLSEIRFYTVDTKEPISNSIYFRWIVSGEDDAEILFVNLDKDSYQAGEEASIQIQYTGPADHELEGGEGTIEIKLFDQEEKLVGEAKKAVKLDVDQLTINVPIKEDVKNPKVVTQILKEEKVLDRYEFQATPLVEEIPEKIEKVGFFEKNKNLIIVFIIIVLITGAIIYYLKLKK